MPAMLGRLLLSALACTLLHGCATTGVTEVPKTQLEIREYQTREYDTKDVKMVMKSLLNVLQDDGFIVKNANVDLGLISATKEVNVENKTEAVLLSLLGGQNATWKKNSVIECSGNVSEHGNVTRVRINFQAKTLDNKGNVINVGQITEPVYYHDFFTKVDKGIFLGKQKV
jgi:hypothetical protein